MKKTTLLTAAALLLTAGQASAFQQITHKRIAIDAVNYMQANPSTTNFNKLQAAANAAGYSVAQMAEIIGQGAYDVDDFADTYICGAITGDCVEAPVWGMAESIVKYTSYWHFQNHTQGSDAHGNDLGGYNYDKLTVWGAVDNAAASWLYNDHLDDGNGGMTGTCFWWSCAEDSEYNSYGITEANYRQGSYSNKGMYEDFQNIPFQPIDNLGQYWYSQFLSQPTFQSLGFVMHTTDLLQPHHVWTTSDLNHAGWEGWVADYYDSENLNDSALVTAALNDFTPVPANQSDIRSLMTEGGAYAYQNGGIVLNSTDHTDRVVVAKKVVPHAIAMVVHILNHAAEQF
ncbi:phospholipase C, PlcB [gamma proteobacterium HTCC5015]|nr:phospholipase C, PlcB [gamma proteobacterium HTCC5015]